MSKIGSFVDDLGIGFDTFVLYYKSWADARRQAVTSGHVEDCLLFSVVIF